MNYESIWDMGYGIWDMGYGIWDMGYGTLEIFIKEQQYDQLKTYIFQNRADMGAAAGEAAAEALRAEIERYTALFNEKPIDLVCMGIGENGHIAFNDPPVADFNDSATIKLVELDAACRQQQVNDGCFPNFDAVPKHALSLTCPALLSAKVAVCTVPTERKAVAVKATLKGPISTSCPASILRTHPSARLYLDAAAAHAIEE